MHLVPTIDQTKFLDVIAILSEFSWRSLSTWNVQAVENTTRRLPQLDALPSVWIHFVRILPYEHAGTTRF
jgi:hypothetical protein